MPRGSHQARSSRTFAIATGWPPAMFTVPASDTYGILSAPTSPTSRSSFARSMFPLNGWSDCGSWASSMITSWNVAPASSWWSRVVVKYMFPGT